MRWPVGLPSISTSQFLFSLPLWSFTIKTKLSVTVMSKNGDLGHFYSGIELTANINIFSLITCLSCMWEWLFLSQSVTVTPKCQNMYYLWGSSTQQAFKVLWLKSYRVTVKWYHITLSGCHGRRKCNFQNNRFSKLAIQWNFKAIYTYMFYSGYQLFLNSWSYKPKLLFITSNFYVYDYRSLSISSNLYT